MKYNSTVYRCLTLISQFAINMLVPIFLCSFGGYYLDRKFGTSFWFILCFFVGAVAGGRNIFILAKKIYDSPETKPSDLYASNRKKERTKKTESPNANKQREIL